MKADKIYLVGFMGAGKSTVARALATRLDWRAEDIDERIERARAARHSEHFQAARANPTSAPWSAQALIDLLPLRGAVVATGGGTFVRPAQSRADAARRRW